MMKLLKQLPKWRIIWWKIRRSRAHIPKPVYPSSTFFTSVLLEEANPPVFIEQTIGLNRPGNNYVAAPASHWYQNAPIENFGPFRIKGVDPRK